MAIEPLVPGVGLSLEAQGGLVVDVGARGCFSHGSVSPCRCLRTTASGSWSLDGGALRGARRAEGATLRAAVNTLEHDELVELIGRAPSAAVEALASTGLVELPPFDQLRVEPGDLRELVPPARNVDVVILLERGVAVFVLLVEVQAGIDPDKLFTWPFHGAALRARFRCPVCLMVLALNDAVAAWAGRIIETGQPGSAFAPLVVRREMFPRVTDPEQARREPYKAILGTLLHGHEAGAEHLAVAAAAGAETLPGGERDMWLELMALSLNEVSKKALEAMMNIEDFRERSVWAKQAKLEGKVEGLQQAVLDLCEVLGLELDEARRARLASLDLAALEALRLHIKSSRAWPG
jgi:hypothetical protein